MTDANGQSKWTKVSNRWVNDEGVGIILSIVYNYATKTMYLGNFSRQEINFKCCVLKKKLARLMFSDYKKYEIERSKRRLIIQMIMDVVHSSLSRSEDGLEGHQLSTSSQQVHHIHENKNNESLSN